MTETSTGVSMTAAYRLQLQAGAGFDFARRIVPYLADLGVSHLYLSPVLQSVPGSLHGYDVVDHSRVSAALGGEEGLVALAATAHDHGLGVICDVVPNHMAVPSATYLNSPLWRVLRDGRAAEAASWFDIEWDLCDGRVGLPFLDRPLGAVLAAGELTLGTHQGAPVVCYRDQVFPVAEGTSGGDVGHV
ncbi:MAG: malto-oligosyltrehalose synthase, partial [Nocardioidaceae bacterium]|nr:malto-oligosyltrehalose synthase [Nocardioidaceae bacterium]